MTEQLNDLVSSQDCKKETSFFAKDEKISVPEQQAEKEIKDDETSEKIEEVRSWLEAEQPGERGILDAVDAMQKEIQLEKKVEKEKGAFAMMKELWGVTAPDRRAQLIGEFIFNPNALKSRYNQEKYFQENLEKGWKNK